MITQGSAAVAGERSLPSLPDGADANGFSKCAWCWRGTSKQLLPGSPIEIERYRGALFLSHGEKDDVWSVNRTKRLEKRLRDAGRRPEVHYYPGANASPDTGRAEGAPDPARRFFSAIPLA